MSKIERVERANAELQRQLREKESELKRLSVRSSLDKDFRRIQTLEEKLREAYYDVERFEAEVVAARDREAKLQYELDILRSVVNLRDHPELLRVADAEVRCKKMDNELRVAREELVSTNEKCRVYFDSCTKAAREADSLRYKCSQLQDEVDRIGADLKDVLREREGWLREREGLHAAINDLKEEIDERHNELSAVKEKMIAREQAHRQLQKAFDELKVDEESARSTWQEGHALYENVVAKLKTAEGELQKLRVEVRLSKDENTTTQHRYDSLQRSSESLRSENKQMRDQLAVWQTRANEIDAMGKRLAITDAEQEKKNGKLALLEEQCQSLLQRLAEKDRECSALNSELETARDDLGVQTEQMNVLSRNLVARLEGMELERDTATQERDALRRELQDANDKIATLTVLTAHHQELSRSAVTSVLGPSAVSERLTKLLEGHASELPSYSRTSRRVDPLSTAALLSKTQAQPATASPLRSAQQNTLHNLSDVALSPPTPLPSQAIPHDKQQSLRQRLERLSK